MSAPILVYALHYEGAFNKNSLGAVSEGARLASELGTTCDAIVVGEGVSDELAGQLGAYGASKVYRVEGPEGLAQYTELKSVYLPPPADPPAGG